MARKSHPNQMQSEVTQSDAIRSHPNQMQSPQSDAIKSHPNQMQSEVTQSDVAIRSHPNQMQSPQSDAIRSHPKQKLPQSDAINPIRCNQKSPQAEVTPIPNRIKCNQMSSF